MLFQVVDSRFEASPHEQPCIVLKRDLWNDSFRYHTQFRAFYAPPAGAAEFLGHVKILEKAADRTTLPTSFTALEKRFCSLGQDLDYYHRIAGLGEARAREVLTALRDIVFDPSIAQDFEQEPAFEQSLLRFSDARKARAEAGTLFGKPAHRPEAGPLEFNFECKLEGFDAAHHIHFAFPGEKEKLGRMMALVGRNGTGKTRLLAALARALSGLGGGEGILQPDLRARTIAISFSAFDRFVRPEDSLPGGSYSYYGLRRPPQIDSTADGLVDIEYAFERLRESLDGLARGGRELQRRWSRWLEGAGLFRAEPHIEDPFESGELEPFLKHLRRTGSGHQLVVFVVTGLVESVRQGSIILFDEPELHLHPNMLSTLMRLLYDALEEVDAYAILATHSPIVLQEIPARSIRIIDLEGRRPIIDPYQGESFGENLSEIVASVFRTSDDDKNYITILEELVRRMDRSEVEARFNNLGLAMRILLRELYREKGRDEKA